MVAITNYISPNLVIFFDVTTRDEAIKELIDLLDSNKKLVDKEAFYHAILAREKIVSTGIGMGVAIPHAKLPDFDDFFIAVGIQKEGINWDALDGAPVQIVFMIGGPDDKQTEYLQILSRLTTAIKDNERRKKLLELSSKEEITQHFEGF
ncbi:PTS sugar transporter subunit IIA [Simkania negevensis]|uniref:PTS sugar transporter subunit IIA n=1 Tax=Simkania negevensis TaxID=83561 RepID=A0ABS3AQX7_9BACT|nr:PTS sugar transporter subunit IIA [Simkania negevensis]